LKKFEDAMVFINQALDAERNSADFWYQKADILFNLDKYDECVNALDEVIHLEPDNVDALELRALALFNAPKYEQASRTADQVLELDKENPSALAIKGSVPSASSEEGIQFLKKALEKEPELEWAGERLVTLLDAAGHWDDVITISEHWPKSEFMLKMK